jgi:hypothetical protein
MPKYGLKTLNNSIYGGNMPMMVMNMFIIRMRLNDGHPHGKPRNPLQQQR